GVQTCALPIYARARGEEVADRRLLLLRRQPLVVVDPELGERRVEPDPAALGVDPVEHGEDALPDRREVADDLDVAVLHQDSPADNGHEPGGRHRLETFPDACEPFARPADRLRALDPFPRFARVDWGR